MMAKNGTEASGDVDHAYDEVVFLKIIAGFFVWAGLFAALAFIVGEAPHAIATYRTMLD